MKTSAYIALVIFIGWVFVSIVQLWSALLDWDTYWKLTVTAILAVIGIVVAGLIYREYIEEEQMKKDGYIE